MSAINLGNIQAIVRGISIPMEADNTTPKTYVVWGKVLNPNNTNLVELRRYSGNGDASLEVNWIPLGGISSVNWSDVIGRIESMEISSDKLALKDNLTPKNTLAEVVLLDLITNAGNVPDYNDVLNIFGMASVSPKKFRNYIKDSLLLIAGQVTDRAQEEFVYVRTNSNDVRTLNLGSQQSIDFTVANAVEDYVTPKSYPLLEWHNGNREKVLFYKDGICTVDINISYENLTTTSEYMELYLIDDLGVIRFRKLFGTNRLAGSLEERGSVSVAGFTTLVHPGTFLALIITSVGTTDVTFVDRSIKYSFRPL